MIKLKEYLYNRFGWRLSDREELVAEKAFGNALDDLQAYRLSEREEYIIRVVSQMEKGELA